MVDAARALLLSLLTGAPLGALADELARPDRIDELAGAFVEVPGALVLGVEARQAHLAVAAPDVARETLAVVAPLVERMGLAPRRAALEDRSFAVLDPEGFGHLAAALGPAPDVAPLVDALRGALAAAGVQAELSGRVKSLYGVHAKMARKGVPADAIYDRIGLRAVVADVADAYAALAAVHATFRPIPGELDDYVASPKPSGYRALHTAVEMPGAGAVEVQIRTAAHHADAERGAAAHWRYKLG
jgi:(p)ppGpp synthase/HD superfamily hydrolase